MAATLELDENRFNTERLAYWQGHGAQLSPTAERLVKQSAAKKAA